MSLPAPSRETGIPSSEGPPRHAARAAVRSVLARADALAERIAARASDTDRAGAFPAQAFAWMAEAGLLAAPLPPRHGGDGLGGDARHTSALLSVLRHLGRGNLSVARLYEGHVNALMLIYRFGTPAQQERCAAAVHSGKRFAVWNTEARDGVRLEHVGEGRYRLRGAKTFASGAGHLERPLITAQLPPDHPQSGEPQMLVVPADEAANAAATTVDESWWTPVGMRASASYKIDFTGVEVGREELIGKPGDYHREPFFTGGAIRFAAAQLGGAEALLALVRRHLQEAERTGDPHQRRRAAETAVAIESARRVLDRGADLFDAHARPDETAGDTASAKRVVVSYAQLARAAVERACTGALERAERSIGARGMMQPHPLERVARDLRVYLRQPAPDAALDALGRYVLETPGRPPHHLWTDAPADDPSDDC